MNGIAYVLSLVLPRPAKIWLMRLTMRPPAIYGGLVEDIAPPEISGNPFKFE